jgi:O-methyltransferase
MPFARESVERLQMTLQHEAAKLRRRLVAGGSGKKVPPVAPVVSPTVNVTMLGPEGPKVFWPAFPPEQYLGQLEEGFQQRLAAERAFVDLADCNFYHVCVRRSGEVIDGAWDLRGGEGEYLGEVVVKSKRVLEFGPASGYLTYYMEDQGAHVTCVDVGFDKSLDLLPVAGLDMGAHKLAGIRTASAVQNSWWYMHRDLDSSARVVYGSVYDLPGDLGTFDVSTFGCILLHLHDPFSALAQAARRTREAIVVTDLVPDTIEDLDQNVMSFDPVGSSTNLVHWWSFSPGAVVRMVQRLGFERTSVLFHSQKYHPDHDLSLPLTEVQLFTVVGRRA